MNNILRIFPLSSEEFPEGCDVKCYFQYGLKLEGGKFYYRHKGMVVECGTIVLFQYDSRIVAQAELLKVQKLETPLPWDGAKYEGYFLFDLETVRFYKTPLNSDEFHKIYPDKPLGRTIHKLEDETLNTKLLHILKER